MGDEKLKDKYIADVIATIDSKSAKRLIKAELEDHIDSKTEYYCELGYSPEESERRAVEEMGDPDSAAVPLKALHKGKWYKKPLTVVAITALLLVTAVLFLFRDCLYYTSDFCGCIHTVTADILSLGLFAVYLGLIIFARKRKNKLVALLVVSYLIAEFLLSFIKIEQSLYLLKALTQFQPIVYVVLIILTQGFSGYADSAFSYGFVPSEYNLALSIGSVILYLILVIYATLVFVAILRQERMKSCRTALKGTAIFGKMLSVTVAVLSVIVICSTTAAVVGFDEKADELKAERNNILNFVINEDVGGSYEAVTQDMQTAGFAPNTDSESNNLGITAKNLNTKKLCIYSNESNNLFVYKSEGSNYVTYFDSRYVYYNPAMNIYYHKHSVSSDDLSRFKYNSDISSLISSEIFDYATFVEKDYKNITVRFIVDFKSESLCYRNGKLQSNTVLDLSE